MSQKVKSAEDVIFLELFKTFHTTGTLARKYQTMKMDDYNSQIKNFKDKFPRKGKHEGGYSLNIVNRYFNKFKKNKWIDIISKKRPNPSRHNMRYKNRKKPFDYYRVNLNRFFDYAEKEKVIFSPYFKRCLEIIFDVPEIRNLVVEQVETLIKREEKEPFIKAVEKILHDYLITPWLVEKKTETISMSPSSIMIPELDTKKYQERVELNEMIHQVAKKEPIFRRPVRETNSEIKLADLTKEINVRKKITTQLRKYQKEYASHAHVKEILKILNDGIEKTKRQLKGNNLTIYHKVELVSKLKESESKAQRIKNPFQFFFDYFSDFILLGDIELQLFQLTKLLLQPLTISYLIQKEKNELESQGIKLIPKIFWKDESVLRMLKAGWDKETIVISYLNSYWDKLLRIHFFSTFDIQMAEELRKEKSKELDEIKKELLQS
jgi:hypothetical protein